MHLHNWFSTNTIIHPHHYMIIYIMINLIVYFNDYDCKLTIKQQEYHTLLCFNERLFYTLDTFKKTYNFCWMERIVFKVLPH